MISKNTTKITILLKKNGLGVIGLLSTDFICSVVKADGTKSTYNLTGNISEIDSINCPGLYLITLQSTILDQSGKLSVLFFNSTPSTFDSYLYNDDIGISGGDFLQLKKFLINNQVIDQSAGTLNILDDNNSTIFMSYYLQDEQTLPSIFNIRRRIRKS